MDSYLFLNFQFFVAPDKLELEGAGIQLNEMGLHVNILINIVINKTIIINIVILIIMIIIIINYHHDYLQNHGYQDREEAEVSTSFRTAGKT